MIGIKLTLLSALSIIGQISAKTLRSTIEIENPNKNLTMDNNSISLSLVPPVIPELYELFVNGSGLFANITSNKPELFLINPNLTLFTNSTERQLLTSTSIFWDDIKNDIHSIVNKTKFFFENFPEEVSEFGHKTDDVFGKVGEFIKHVIVGAGLFLNEASKKADNFVKNDLPSIINTTEHVIGDGINLVNNITGVVTSAINEVSPSVKEISSEIKSGVKDIKNDSENIKSSFTGLGETINDSS